MLTYLCNLTKLFFLNCKIIITDKLKKIYPNIEKVKNDYQKGKIFLHTYIWLNLKETEVFDKNELVKIRRKRLMKKLLFVF